MKVRPGPVAAVLLLAVFGGYAWFKDYRGADERKKAEESKDKLFRFERADLKAITLTGKNGAIRLERSGEDWVLRQPIEAPAEKDAVEGVLSSLEMAKVERRLGPGDDLKTYALAPPQGTVTVETTGGPPQTLALGDQAPLGGTWFALVDDGKGQGGKEVAVVSAAAGDLASKDLLSLRDKSLLAFDPWKVMGLTIERGRETITLQKPAEGWKLAQPVEAPADGPAITDLLSALERARATKFVVEKATDADLKAHGFVPPAARVTILQEGWDTAKTIEFGAEEAGARQARTVGKDGIVALLPEFWTKLTAPAGDLRRKDVLGVGQYRVRSVSASRDGGPALVLTKGAENTWNATGLATGPVKYDSVDLLLRRLSDVKAVAFEDHPTEAQKNAFAAKPPLDLTLEEEPDTEKGTPRRQHLAFSPVGKAARVTVRDFAWGPLFVVDGGNVAQVHQSLEDIAKEATEAAAKPAETPAPKPPAETPATPPGAPTETKPGGNGPAPGTSPN
ncbi:MAG TPA: DUF4340 domain-containing protein [Candidatus Polarisedimenticolia bacterium]|nr:DUF4340 domain-containing protein [Candidatus Polarisedimenticolia bacterium]